mmetsp:Transcript_13298/g.2090  ORF Transcript_13298/g.2090 Transcript_13298/m.2090 type:complete len:119 (+) Transcript_13298:1705-2061(+)
MDIHQAYIIFCDEKVGELQYTLVGKVKLPEPFEIPAVKGEMGSNVNIDIPLEPRNRFFELAKAKCRERFQSSNKAKEREQLNEIFKKLQAEDSNIFEVQITSPYFSGPNTITIQDLGR